MLPAATPSREVGSRRKRVRGCRGGRVGCEPDGVFGECGLGVLKVELRSLGAMWTSVLVVSRSALALVCGLRDTTRPSRDPDVDLLAHLRATHMVEEGIFDVGCVVKGKGSEGRGARHVHPSSTHAAAKGSVDRKVGVSKAHALSLDSEAMTVAGYSDSVLLLSRPIASSFTICGG
ncbi:hypothetical protein FIBSPDRAFT_940131 [Athelia psychrophila]|uniref:Uncharacterized protein n=1 Tax=Athelia psychrophila TaxID=1759441 RepID=A0A167WJW3_9AGAM|nr:hypothetical protein FIBSPDRAFT_940131 [Fibularhizoctonia sp. CBS 109695]